MTTGVLTDKVFRLKAGDELYAKPTDLYKSKSSFIKRKLSKEEGYTRKTGSDGKLQQRKLKTIGDLKAEIAYVQKQIKENIKNTEFVQDAQQLLLYYKGRLKHVRETELAKNKIATIVSSKIRGAKLKAKHDKATQEILKERQQRFRHNCITSP